MKVIATEKAPRRHRPLLAGLSHQRFCLHLRPDPGKPRRRHHPRRHRRTGGAELQERRRHSGSRRQRLLTRWSRPPASWPTSRILRPSTRFTPSSSSPPAAVSPSRTCPRASCARSRPSQRRDPPPAPGSGCCIKLQKSQNCAAVWQTSSGFCCIIGPDALP